MKIKASVYRLVGLDGLPHPVLDTPYDSIEAAIKAANSWSSNKNLDHLISDTSLGIEVLTSNGSWRTVQYS